MMSRLRQIVQGEKGQSVVEWGLVALFAVGMFFMFHDSSLLPQVSKTYDRVGSYLSGTPLSSTIPTAEDIIRYGTISNTELSKVDNAQRIALDEASLRNLARAFLGKDASASSGMFINDLKFKNYKYNSEKGLKQGILLFDYNIKSTGENGAVKTEFSGNEVSKDNIVNWLEGNYTISSEKNKTLESDQRYFFSDDLIDPYGIKDNTVQNNETWAVSVRCAFEVSQGKVSAVHIWASRNKKDKSNNKVDYPDGWIRQGAEGLVDIVVTE
ncbi:hypothetical protein SELR_00300 [Selenomonas ruminantium subsp. lactilytica TAM6421]|uniref:Uncharacterized protein n=1 Tax=Selenomonas ruminantium subsp. lactilytica (strain NBRC 103574 / TAM6421) TaxID=927704 RepID=I0GLV1_SELRL|nr:hypothetical protein [Selenomonas ruminantium]BAL81738.1 hypothetical protein SELR_00300 [Selenomonas ruminantium subsp. lactilytica TAM6421]